MTHDVASGRTTSSQPLPSALGDFWLLEKIAEGGMAEVFLARRAGSGEDLFAVKRLHAALAQRGTFVDMFAREGQVAVWLRHPNIVRTFLAGTDQTNHFLAMEYLSGRELRDVARYLTERESKLPLPAVLWIAEQILAALAYSHEARDPQGNPLNLVNRDVSPTNVLVTYDGEVKLIDFGIAQTTVGFTTQIGQIKGKIAYMSPEQVRGLPVDRRSDVFSAGIVLHELLTGRRLFTGESDFSLMEAVRAAPIPPPSSRNPLVEPELDRLVQRALARSVEERFPDAGVLAEELLRYRRARGLAYGSGELGAWLRAAFADAYRLERQRLERARRAPLSAPVVAGGAVWDAQAADRPVPPAGDVLLPEAAPARSSARSLLPVLAGLLLGLALSALIYWLVLGS
ncbi:MAG: serine/threonine-protein kinase [Myxococcota bacterium]|jgi:serine/threonine protein kinase|nr:serine/threonine-protein kinase [Myxococcota bacterium]